MPGEPDDITYPLIELHFTVIRKKVALPADKNKNNLAR